MSDYTTSKRCPKCKEVLPIDSFGPNRSARDGHNTYCRKCARLKDYERRGTIPRELKAKPGFKWCNICKTEKPATTEFFSLASKARGGLAHWCRDCQREYFRRKYEETKDEIKRRNAEWVKNNPDKQRNRVMRWRKMNPERAKETDRKRRSITVEAERARFARRRARKKAAEGNYTGYDIKLLYRSQNGKCWWCGCDLNGKYEVDHRVPLTRGGTNWPNNLCLSCSHCNRSKNNKLPHEWNGRLL